MDGLLFFSRLELTNFYGRMDKHLKDKFNVYHLAYSDEEEKTLLEKYNIKSICNFKKESEKIVDAYKYDEKIIKEIDELFIEVSGGRFCLSSAIRYDRSFRLLKYEECLQLAQSYYIFWTKILNENKIDYIFHEPPAIFLTHLLANMAKKRGIKYLSQSQVIGKNRYNWIMIEGDNGSPVEILLHKDRTKDSDVDVKEAKEFIEKFRSESKVLFAEISRNKHKTDNVSFIKGAAKLTLNALFAGKKNSTVKLNDHLEHFMEKGKTGYFEELSNRLYFNYELTYDEFLKEKDYFYYPLHAEPEAAVLYRGDGVYEGQVKLIENIAEQLPPNCFLYIKDHPHRPAFKSLVYFKRLKQIPNVKLINPSIPGMEITRNAKGVITISGTSGFESLLLNKPVYLFGNAFYNHNSRIIHVRHIRDFRKVLYENFNKTFEDDMELYRFVDAFLKASHSGFINYFPGHVKMCKVDHDDNITEVSGEFAKAINFISSGKVTN